MREISLSLWKEGGKGREKELSLNILYNTTQTHISTFKASKTFWIFTLSVPVASITSIFVTIKRVTSLTLEAGSVRFVKRIYEMGMDQMRDFGEMRRRCEVVLSSQHDSSMVSVKRESSKDCLMDIILAGQ